MTATAARPATIQHRTSNLSVVLTLGRFEGRQMIRHPLFWLGVIASVAWAIIQLTGTSPVLNRASVTLAWTMTPIGAAVALLAGWAALRAKGRTDADPPAVMPVSLSRRMAGVVVGLTWPVVATFCLQLVLLGWVFARDPVTSIVWTELLVGPGFVLLVGTFSAALTRWWPLASSPLVALLVVAASQVVLRPYFPERLGSAISPSFLAPIGWPQDIIPYELAFRPSVLHLGYIVGLILLMSGIATLARSKSSWLLAGIGLIGVGLLGPAQMGTIDQGQRAAVMAPIVGDQADLTCETHDTIEYCAMPGYQSWIDHWAEAVRPMLVGVPTGIIEDLEVRQYPVHNVYQMSESGGNGWWWVEWSYRDLAGRDVAPVGSVLADYTLNQELVGNAARRLVGCDFGCEGQGQELVAIWLVAHDPKVRENIAENVTSESDSQDVTLCMVADLWNKPDADDLVRSNWAVLTDPDTSYEEAGAVLRIEVPQGYDQYGRLEGGCP